MTENKTPKRTNPSPWMIDLAASDNALAPVITKGETIAIDCSERDLVDGGIYAIKMQGDMVGSKAQADVGLWLFHEGFAGLGPLASGEDIGTLSSLAGSFRCSGPVAIDAMKVIGRLASDVSERSVTSCARERGLLLAALDECRLAMRRQSGGLRDLNLIDANHAGDTLSLWHRRFEEINKDADLSKRFALEQRIDALSARLMFLEDRIADGVAANTHDVTAKLQVLWDLHHAAFPATHGDLAARIVATSLRGLNSPVDVPGQQPPETDGYAPSSPAIKLVSSPRRR